MFQNSKIISTSENSSCLDGKFRFVLEASRRSNTSCLQLFTKEIEAYPGESAAASIISRCLNNQGGFQLNYSDAKVSCSLVFAMIPLFPFHIYIMKDMYCASLFLMTVLNMLVSGICETTVCLEGYYGKL